MTAPTKSICPLLLHVHESYNEPFFVGLRDTKRGHLHIS